MSEVIRVVASEGASAEPSATVSLGKSMSRAASGSLVTTFKLTPVPRSFPRERRHAAHLLPRVHGMDFTPCTKLLTR